MSNTEKMIEDHRKMVIMTGKLSDFHLENLKNWSYIFFDNVEKAEISYNFLKNDEEAYHGSITFDLYFSKSPTKNKDLQDRATALKRATKELFWEDTQVDFKQKGVEWEI